MRRLVVSACALGLLLALPSAAAAKEVAVAVSLEIRQGNKAPNNCAAAAYLQWEAQKGAEAWRLEYLWNGKLEKRKLKPPFSDAPHSVYGWAPAEGAHWYLASIGSKSASEESAPVDCTDHAVARTNAFGGGTIYITVPDTSEDEEKEKEEEEKKRKEEEEKTPKSPPDDEEVPPGKRGKAKCRGKTPTIFVEPGPPTNGTAGRDVILGTPKRDVIRARGGNDLVCGLGGNDIVLGGGGRDVLLGQGGADTLHGQAGRDTVLGGGGADRIFGQAAADRLFGQAGADFLNGGAGRPDLCNGGADRDERRSPGCERRRLIP
ncbi:MAG TPA: calcium-binding protein [Solirubrobacterales bacterium]|nr:calcium-binding protein [Solirubrobacterales bacterium]